jgi:hypothetical protein
MKGSTIKTNNFCFCTDLDRYIRLEKAAIASSQPGTKVDNPFVGPSRTEIDSLSTALDALQILTSRTHQSIKSQTKTFPHYYL